MRFLLALLVVSVVACSSKNLPPVAPEDVQVFMPGVPTPFEYTEVWRSNDSFASKLTDEIIEKAKKEAGKRGADAVLFEEISGNTASGARTREGNVELVGGVVSFSYRVIAVLITKPKY